MTHQLRRYVLPRTIALAAAVLIGCANYVSVTRIEPSTFASRESVVLLSVGAERLCFDGAAAGLGLYRRSPTLGRYEAVLEVPQIAMDTSMTDQELPDTHERLAAFVVRPGAYFFLPERRAGVVATKTPEYTGPVRPGAKLPEFAATRADGTSFTSQDVEDEVRSVLVFFRGRW